jgi:SSS family solute:Na+ symporter
MVVIAVLYATHQSFGAYEGFWGLIVNILCILILNPIFAERAQERNNPVMETLFGKKGTKSVMERKIG